METRGTYSVESMFMLRRLFSLCMVLGILFSCGPEEKKHRSDGRISGRDYEMLNGQNEEGANGYYLSGNGIRALFIEPIVEDSRVSRNFKLDFDLRHKESVTFVAFSDDALGNGVNVVFKRVGNSLYTHVECGRFKTSHTVTELEDRSEFARVSVYVDIQNNLDSTRVLVWPDFLKSHTHPDFTVSGAIFDSRNFPFDGRGDGTHMGVKLEGATFHAVEVSHSRLQL